MESLQGYIKPIKGWWKQWVLLGCGGWHCCRKEMKYLWTVKPGRLALFLQRRSSRDVQRGGGWRCLSTWPFCTNDWMCPPSESGMPFPSKCLYTVLGTRRWVSVSVRSALQNPKIILLGKRINCSIQARSKSKGVLVSWDLVHKCWQREMQGGQAVWFSDSISVDTCGKVWVKF